MKSAEVQTVDHPTFFKTVTALSGCVTAAAVGLCSIASFGGLIAASTLNSLSSPEIIFTGGLSLLAVGAFGFIGAKIGWKSASNRIESIRTK